MRFFRKLFKRFRKPATRDGLMFAFRHEGYDYYQYPEQLSIPLFRISKLSEYNIWITRGLTKPQLLELCDLMDQALHEGIQVKKNGKTNASVIGAIINEIKSREKKAVPEDIWYNYLAACYVREDEPLDEFNQQIQDEKSSTFKAAAKDMNSFFFLLPELKALTTHSNSFPVAWRSICHESMIQQNRHRELTAMLRMEITERNRS